MDTHIGKSIPELERELLYCQSKADFISDFLDPANHDFRVTVTLGLSDCVFTTFMIADLYNNDMEKRLLGSLEQLFRLKAKGISEVIRQKRAGFQKLISDGFDIRESVSPGSQ